MGVLDIVKPGVLSGDDVSKVYAYAKQQGFAIPAVNVVGSNSINAVLEMRALLALMPRFWALSQARIKCMLWRLITALR